MTKETLIKLVDAGFSKDDILQLFGPEQNESKGKEPEPKEPEPQDPAPQNVNINEFTEALNGFQQLMQQTLKDIQAANLHAARQPEPKTESPEDILGTIIYPSYSGRKEE